MHTAPSRALEHVRCGAYEVRVANSMASASASVERVLLALSEPTRMRLIALPGAGETCVGQFVTALESPQPVVTRHLGVLRRAVLVEARRDGRWM